MSFMPRFGFAIHTFLFNILASILLLAAPAFSQTAPLITHSAPSALPALEYTDASGNIHAVPRLEGLTILHLWATWCAPCIEELPVLDTIANDHENISFMTLSLDGKNIGKVQDFYRQHGIITLPMYFDPNMKAFRSLKLRGLPATIFIKNGQEIARIDGPADWNSTELRQLLENF